LKIINKLNSKKMVVTTLEVIVVTTLIMLAIAMVVSYIASIFFGKKLASYVITRGMNGMQGTTLNLSCPVGQVIDFTNNNPKTTRGALICTGDASCDAFANYDQNNTFYNPATSIDVFGAGSPFTDLQKCAGQQTCPWTVPLKTDVRLAASGPYQGCLQRCLGKIAFVGTYDCIPAS
jgi:hypothetical protein